ncbi:hypothetical protein ACRF0D_004639, partial [Escherichia coli]
IFQEGQEGGGSPVGASRPTQERQPAGLADLGEGEPRRRRGGTPQGCPGVSRNFGTKRMRKEARFKTLENQ